MSFWTKQWGRFVSALLLAVTFTAMHFSPAVQAQSQKQLNLRQFDLLNPGVGWILLDQHLYWTSDAAQTWVEVGPSMPDGLLIMDVTFIDPNIGWVLLNGIKADGSTSFQLDRTIDGGKTWVELPLSLFNTGEIASHSEKATMHWLDIDHGWILVKQSSGSNFSIGTLFATSDAGVTWKRFSVPVADEIYFSTPKIGWVYGGPTGDQVFYTQDGSATWEDRTFIDMKSAAQTSISSPGISRSKNALMLTILGADNSLSVYTLEDSSSTWLSVGHLQLDELSGLPVLANLDMKNFIGTIPGTRSILRGADGTLDLLKNSDGHSASIVELDMVSVDVGWAKSVESDCVTASSADPKTDSITCSSTTHLVKTADGGITWQPIDFPLDSSTLVASSLQTTTHNSLSNLQNTEVFAGQGFDRCEIPTLSQMQTWWDSSPYKTVNLYIGGSSRACDNNVLISSYLFLLNQQGWKFFPTWVGPQAPCTGYPNRISSDVTIAYDQGLIEANLAVDRLAELGLTGPDKTGSVIYYDIEHYGTNTACRAAVNAFMNGWVAQLRSREHYAGVYGSTLCNTGLSDFLNIPNVPDVIWPARWYNNLGQGYYDPNATVWNLGSCISNTAWADHQRIRQYEGDHNETWGNLTLDIDSNVLDGVVAVPYDYPYVSGIIRNDSNPANTAAVNFTIYFSKSVTGVNASDFKLTTTGVATTSISTVSGSGTIYTVTVNTGIGNGTIRLDVVDNDSIKDAAGNSLGGAGIGNGNFNSGEIYTIKKVFHVSGNAGAGGVTLSYIDGTSKIVTADESGSYSIIVPSGWTGTVTPSKTGFTFDPMSRSYANLTSDQLNQNYIPSWVGGVKVEANRNIIAVGRPHIGSEVTSYDGFASGSLTAYVPMLFKTAWGSYESALYVQNVHPTNTAHITIKYYDSNGVLKCTKGDTLAPLASRGYWVASVICDIGSLSEGWVGGAVVTSDQPIVTVGRPHLGSEVMTYNGFTAGSLTAYIPMLFSNAWGSYNSAFYIQNVHQNNTANITIKYYDSDGNLKCTKDDTLAPLASMGYWVPSTTCDTGSLPDGWVGGAIVTSDQPIVGIGRPHIGSQVTTYTGFTTGGLSSYIPMLFKNAWGAYNGAFYIQNVHQSSVNITMKYYDSSGTLSCTQTDTIVPLASKGYWVPSQTCLPAGWVGGVMVTSDQPIVGLGRPHIGDQVTTYNGFTAGNSNSYLPMLFNNAWGSYNSAFYIQNTEDSTATVTVKLYDTNGNLSCTRMDTIPALSTLGYWVPSITCSP